MALPTQPTRIALLACALLLPLASRMPAWAADRSVTIIEGMPEPVQPSPAIEAPVGAPLQTTNPAGVKLDLLPGSELPVGTNVVFRVTSQKPGYLVLVDVNAARSVTQIYPNVMSLTQAAARRAGANLVKPGVTVAVPDPRNPLARFIFRTEPPLGKGVIVAILSEQPVQLIDLPELSADLASTQACVDAIDQAVRKLLVSESGHPGQFNAGAWSLAAIEYVVK